MRPRTSWFALALLCPPFAGCHVGPRAQTFGPAHTAAGARAEIQMKRGTVAVELLAATDSGLIVLVRDTVLAFAPYQVVEDLRVRNFGYMNLIYIYDSAGRHPQPGALENMRLVSRFPQGVSPVLLAQLLATCHQREPEVLK